MRFAKKKHYGVTNEDTRGCLYHLTEKNASTYTLNIAINVLKYYFSKILKQNFVCKLKKPKKGKELPAVLSREKISRLISSIANANLLGRYLG